MVTTRTMTPKCPGGTQKRHVAVQPASPLPSRAPGNKQSRPSIGNPLYSLCCIFTLILHYNKQRPLFTWFGNFGNLSGRHLVKDV
jgi:hypothetical protein